MTALEKRSNETQDKHRQKQISAKKATEKLDNDIPDEEIKGAKAILLKNQKNFKTIQNKIDESAAKRKTEKAGAAKEDMSIAFKNEKEFRALYHPISEDIINQYVDEIIGNLRRIKKNNE